MIDNLINYAITNGGYMEMDRQYLKNKLIELLGKDMQEDKSLTPKQTAEALAKNATSDEGLQYILFTQMLDMITPPPSVVNALFAEHYHDSVEEATRYYHELLKNIGFFETMYAKTPEDFLDFQAEGSLVSMNNRFIRMNLSGDSWGFQFLPKENREEGMIFPEFPAQYSTVKKVLIKLFEITQVFPNYAISTGPAWFYTNPKETLEAGESFEISNYPLVDSGIIMDRKAILLTSYNVEDLVMLAKKIPYQSYVTMSGTREGNKFNLCILFKDDKLLKQAKEQLMHS